MDRDEYINDTDDVNDLFLRFCDVEVYETEAKLKRNISEWETPSLISLVQLIPSWSPWSLSNVICDDVDAYYEAEWHGDNWHSTI